ncbi:hypothetical protein JCM19241_1345 [Vibrio ishigakensis]|uniref:Uncharacterized protein n=1 Tax=Vibrio ishigakensis TaxID=1481914 RepID=A0A0B8QDJ0_9VIBR|nr:hypothetical protein JCM19241_1345 [Vibrio ishigakensis]
MISDLENFDLNLLSVVRSLVKYKSTKLLPCILVSLKPV